MRNPIDHDVPACPQKYRVAIIETLKRIVEVEADDPDQAEQMVSDGWHRSEYILDAEDFAEVEFEAVVGEQGDGSSTLLACGENPGSKLTKAHELGVPVLTEQESLSMIPM